MKGLVSLTLVVSLFFQANGQAKFSTKCLAISTSTVQSWSPGNVQTGGKAGGGLVYQIDAVLKKAGTFKFDSLVIEGICLPIEVMKGTERGFVGSFKKGDSVTLLARQNKGETNRKSSPGISQLISSRKDVVAYISIWISGKRYLHPVSAFTRTSPHDVNQ